MEWVWRSFIPWPLHTSLASIFGILISNCHIVAKWNYPPFPKHTPIYMQMLISLSVMPFQSVHSNPHPANFYSELECHLLCVVFLESLTQRFLLPLLCFPESVYLLLHPLHYTAFSGLSAQSLGKMKVYKTYKGKADGQHRSRHITLTTYLLVTT